MNASMVSDIPADRNALLATARAIYRNRRLRDDVFGADGTFGEPAWDLLLDLYVATHDRKQVSVTAACAASAVPVTTALRWLGQLERQGLVVRLADPTDRRRMLVSLTPRAIELMETYLAQVVGMREL